MVSLLVWLKLIECLKDFLWVVVGIVRLGVAGLTITVVVPRVHHLRDF
jgi:hypothetical protein